jgi:hypothetical protein
VSDEGEHRRCFASSWAGRQSGEFIDSTTWLTRPSRALDGFKAFSSAKLEGGVPWVRILGEPTW